MRRVVPFACALALAPGGAFAHGAVAGPADLPGWTLEPWLMAPLIGSALAYGIGFVRLRTRAGLGRRALAREGLAFASGWLVLAGALVSPLHQAGERSFAAHMLEHELLMLPAAALLVLARPLGVMLWSLPGAARRATARAVKASGLVALHRALSEPVTATLLQTAVLWGWHAPALFDLALAHEGWHVAQHASFLVSALVFWSAMLHRARPGHAAVCLFATSVVGGALGALMAFSQSPWYARYAALGMAPFGLSATEDQQLAGLLMWVPGGVVHAAAALVLVARTLRDQPREADRVPAP